MMSDDDDIDFTSTNRSSSNLATLFHAGGPSAPPVLTTSYEPPKQPKKDSAPKVMIASVVQAFAFADQKWTPRGKMGVALLSTDNTIFQLILYLTKTEHVTSVRLTTTSTFTSQPNNYLSFQDDSGQNWSIMFEKKQALIDFALQIVLAKAYLSSFKFDSIVQDIREGEGSSLVDQDSVETTLHQSKLLENGTISSPDPGENKPVRFKIGKQQNGKAFDDVLRGMKKNGQRIAMIGTTLYNIEVVRVKREKETRSGSMTVPLEEQPAPPVERKATLAEDNENSNEKNNMSQRIKKMGGVPMLPNQTLNQTSAFASPLPPHLASMSDDDSINNELIPNFSTKRSIPTPVPPVQFVPPTYHPHLHHPQPHLYSPQQQQQSIHDYNTRPGSTMSGMGYQPMPMWPPSQYPPSVSTMPPTDMFYQQPHVQHDVRQLLGRLTEKVDVLNEKFDTKNSTTHPNMETSILLANIQRIVKENETVKKDLLDRTAKVEEQNLKISELLDRNQKLIERSHQTVEERNGFANNVSEQTAQKILDLEKQKVELTNNLSASTSKIADLQLQINQHNQDVNENQSRLSTLLHKSDQYREDLQKSESQRLEVQTQFDAIQEQIKNDKAAKKQLQTKLDALEEELAESKVTCADLEKTNNERKSKVENERKRWQNEMEEQKQTYEAELDELRAKLRKQRSADAMNSTQEITRIEQDLEREWQEKLDRQQTQHERLLTAKTKEFEQLKTSLTEKENQIQQSNEELNELKQQIEVYEEKCEKYQERLSLMKEKFIEMNDEQAQAIQDQVKSAMSTIFQRLKTRIQPTRQYSGEEFLSRALQIIKKGTLKILSNADDDEASTDDVESDEDVQTIEQTTVDDQPSNGDSVDQQTLNEEVSSIAPTVGNEERNSVDSETNLVTNQKNGWDTVDDLPGEDSNIQSQSTEQNQIVEATTTTSSSSEPVPETNETVQEEHESDGSADTIEEDVKEPPPELEAPTETVSSDEENDDELFQSARPSIQDLTPRSSQSQSSAPPRYTFNENIPLMTNPNDSDDELFK